MGVKSYARELTGSAYHLHEGGVVEIRELRSERKTGGNARKPCQPPPTSFAKYVLTLSNLSLRRPSHRLERAIESILVAIPVIPLSRPRGWSAARWGSGTSSRTGKRTFGYIHAGLSAKALSIAFYRRK